MRTRMFRILPIVIVTTLAVSCGDMKCTSSLRERKTDDQIVKELKDKIARELKKDESSRQHQRLLDWYEQLGDRYLMMGVWEQAIVNLEKVIAQGRQSANLHYSLGLAYANRGRDLNRPEDFDRAESQYRRSLDYGMVRNEAGFALAVLLYYQKNKKDDGLRLMEEFASKNKKHYRSRFGLARMYYDSGRPDQSLATYEELYGDLEKLPDSNVKIEYIEACKNNMQRLQGELARPGSNK